MIQLDENQFAFLYMLAEAREKGEYMPLSMLKRFLNGEFGDERVIALTLEHTGLVECTVDDRLAGNARYKYKLTAKGAEHIRDILRAPGTRVTHVVRQPIGNRPGEDPSKDS